MCSARGFMAVEGECRCGLARGRGLWNFEVWWWGLSGSPKTERCGFGGCGLDLFWCWTIDGQDGLQYIHRDLVGPSSRLTDLPLIPAPIHSNCYHSEISTNTHRRPHWRTRPLHLALRTFPSHSPSWLFKHQGNQYYGRRMY